MDDERNAAVLAEEFIPDDEQIEHQIEAEWDARSQRGETIRPDDGAKGAYG